MTGAAFKYSESRLAHEIGMSRTAIRELRERDLQEGIDWKQKNGAGEVLLSRQAVDRIINLTNAQNHFDLEDCIARKGAPQARRKKMRVVSPMPLNPRVVLAEGEDGERHLVWVGRNENFCFEDEIEVEPHEVQTGIWQFIGEMPRNRRRPYHG